MEGKHARSFTFKFGDANVMDGVYETELPPQEIRPVGFYQVFET